MEFMCSKGDKVILVDKLSQKFEGIVKSVNSDSGTVLLTQVIQHPDKVIEGYRHFDKNEILYLNVFDRKKEDSGIEENDTCMKPPDFEPKDTEPFQNVYTYIDDFNSDFFLAMKLIKKCSKIGFCMMDVSKGRLERTSLLAISTSLQIFVFDIHILGDGTFSRGLKEILESPEITKVVHDCRLLSDCLKHKYLVNLENVRDVEAEDIMVVYQERRMIRKHSRNLNYLVKLYLNSEISTLNVFAEEWSKRPLALKFLEHVAQLVSFLLPLHEMIEKKYLERLVNASCIYNNFVRSSDMYESVHCNVKCTLKQQMINLVKRQDKPRTNSYGILKIS